MTVTHVYADTEQLLVGWAPTVIPCRALTETPADLETVLDTTAVVRVTRIGGSSAVGIDEPLVDFDCFALTRTAAKAFAIQLASAVDLQLSGYFNQYGTVNAVVMVSGPSWRPWENTNIRRFGFTARLTVHTRT